MVPERALGDTSRTEDMVAPFQIEGEPVRGRIARLGTSSLDPILKRHDYDPELARLLGEALMLAALVGSAMKFQGKVMVQAEGNGPISLLVAEYSVNGDLRGYVRKDAEKWSKLMRVNKGARPHMPQLFGAKGVLGLIIIHDDPSMKPYQGVVPLQKGTLAECAEDYFRQSEQVESRISLAVGELSVPGASSDWRGGGLLIQKVAGDEARGDTEAAWETANALFTTLGDAELIAPDNSPDRLLYRLFHETGVRMGESQGLSDACSCNEERLRGTLMGLSDDGLRDLVEPDGTLSVNCQFCNRHYSIPLEDVTAKPDA
ncbi:MAG: Hsp33 family molecular chaperone HslO [Pseudomonadota bacterium]